MEKNIDVAIIMGSDSDLPIMKDSAKFLDNMGISYEMKILSVHRCPDEAIDYAKNLKNRGVKAIIAGAGGAAHLPGIFAAVNTCPVIGVPIHSKALNGIDFIIPAVEQSQTLHHTILEFAKAQNIEFNIVQKADNILFNINSIGMGLGCTILPGYIAPLTMSNTVIRPLEVELPYLDLYVSYRKNNSSLAVNKFLELLTRVFYLDINRE